MFEGFDVSENFVVAGGDSSLFLIDNTTGDSLRSAVLPGVLVIRVLLLENIIFALEQVSALDSFRISIYNLNLNRLKSTNLFKGHTANLGNTGFHRPFNLIQSNEEIVVQAAVHADKKTKSHIAKVTLAEVKFILATDRHPGLSNGLVVNGDQAYLCGIHEVEKVNLSTGMSEWVVEIPTSGPDLTIDYINLDDNGNLLITGEDYLDFFVRVLDPEGKTLFSYLNQEPDFQDGYWVGDFGGNIVVYAHTIDAGFLKIVKTAPTTDVEATTPRTFALDQNYPNPFNPTTNITYSIEKQGAVSLVVYNLLGNEIARLVDNQIQTVGNHTISFDASGLSSGVYFYKLQTNNTSVTKKMLLMK